MIEAKESNDVEKKDIWRRVIQHFNATGGIRQDDIMSPTIFNIVTDAVV
jgi:hypothetical protein